MNDEHVTQTFLIWALVTVMSVVLYIGIYKQNEATQRIAGANLTQQVCDGAYKAGGKSQTQCGDLQDKYNVEYLCSNGTCWVEIK